MLDIITRAGCFVTIIMIGYILRRINFFDEHAFKVLSKIVVKITLPAAIITSFAGKEIDPALLVLALIGLGSGVLLTYLGYTMNRKGGKEQQAFYMVNNSGYNIGNFTLPFVQSFLGSSGVIAASIFDVGNAFVCLGGAHSFATMVKGGGHFSLKKLIKALVKSVAFDCYVLMLLINLVKIQLPGPFLDLAQIIANANAFIAMLMIGVGFKLSGNRSQLKAIAKILSIRYAVGILVALGSYFLLPFSLEVRQAVMILVFSPIASAAPAFTGEMKGDTGLASAVNSMSILGSIIIIVCMLTIVI